MNEISSNRGFFIKLGQGGEWENECIKKAQTIRLGFREADHQDCVNGRWDALKDFYIKRMGKTKGKATESANQIKAFYEEDDKTLWITFYDDHMWWCFAEPQVTQLPDGDKTRRVIGEWCNRDVTDEPLALDSLSGRLIQVQGFRGTICQVKEKTYAINRINGKKSPEVVSAIKASEDYSKSLEPLVKSLTWGDFEILVDLVFSKAGWQRIGVLGGVQKDWDIILMAPVTGERSVVQVKSHSNMTEFDGCVKKFKETTQYDRLFFVVHSFDGVTPASEKSIFFVGPKKLAELVIDAGLSSWLIKKNS